MMSCECAIITHPSVRIRGTENDYTPKQCLDPNCGIKPIHMHCPFCVRTEVYHDVVILRAHYRVKHVDKGIEFAGLKILRCCSQCDIVGAIKGEKKFKGAHWHCYKCKNGFNRRDEAIKHYKTHFRNPLTTFQIHITQEVNSPIQGTGGYETVQSIPIGMTSSLACNGEVSLNEPSSAVLNLNVCYGNESDSSVTNGNSSEMEADGEENTVVNVDSEAVMVIHEEPMDGSNICGCQETTIFENGEDPDSDLVNVEDEAKNGEIEKRLRERLLEMEERNEKLKLKNEHLEQHYKDEIEQYRMQVELQSKEIENLKKREQDLLHHLMGDSCDRSQELIASLQAQHTELLQQHMLQVRQMALLQQQTTGNSLTLTEVPTTSSNVVTLILDSQGTLLAPGKLSLLTRDNDGETGVEKDGSIGSNIETLLSKQGPEKPKCTNW